MAFQDDGSGFVEITPQGLQLSDKLQQLLERYNLTQYQKFSPSSETYKDDSEVLNEAEQLIEDELQVTETADSTEKTAKPRRPRIAPELPRVMTSPIKPVPATAMPCIKWVKRSASNLSSCQRKSGCLKISA